MFRKLSVVMFSLFVLAGINAQTWKSDKAHSKLRFSVTHLGISEIDGKFQNFDATITTSNEDFSDASVELTIETASVSTENEGRDNHLKRDDMFDAEQYPTITFKSTGITKKSDGKFVVKGDLTIKGVTKSVDIDMILNGLADDRRSGKKIAGITVNTVIKRTDFGVGNMPALMVGDEITVRASGEFKQQ